MLPTATEFPCSFGSSCAPGGNASRLEAGVITGFVAVWVIAGTTSQVADRDLHALAATLKWRAARPELIASPPSPRRAPAGSPRSSTGA